MTKLIVTICGLGVCTGLLTLAPATGAGQDASAPLYENDFEKAEPGKVPDDFLVTDGAFVVREEAGARFLELPGAPLDTFGILFGPAETNNVAVAARAFGTAKGRRSPTFAVGLNGIGGYRLQVAPGKRTLDLYRGDAVVTNAPYAWEAGTWTLLRLQVTQLKENEWSVAGKAWPEGAKEPAAWQVTFLETTAPVPGRASIWGSPFAGTPLRFDDFKVTRVKSP